MDLKYEESQTLKFQLVGSYSKVEIDNGLKQSSQQLYEQYEDYLVFYYDLPRDVAKNLIHTYGTMSVKVAKLGKEQKLNTRVHPEYPFLNAEIAYAVKYEMAEKPNDIICRRVPIGFLNQKLAFDLLPHVVDIMGKEKKWSTSQKKSELEEAREMLKYLK